MNRCLGERALFSLYEGEGTDADRTHLHTCAGCATRYDQLAADLELVRRTLRDGPMPRRAPRSSGAVLWMTAAALATVALALGVRGFERGRALLAEDGVASLSLGDVSTALFAADAAEDALSVSDTDREVASLQAALRGEWPCERQDPLADQDCD